jgi:hypothetical protein
MLYRPSARTEIPRARRRCRRRLCRGRRACSASNTGPSRGRSRRAGHAWACRAPRDRSCPAGRGGCGAGWQRSSRGDTSPSTIPRRCPPCRRGRSRWAGSASRGRCARSRPPSCCGRGSGPGRCWPSSSRGGGSSRPRRRAAASGRRARHIPTPPRWGGASPPTSRRRLVVEFQTMRLHPTDAFQPFRRLFSAFSAFSVVPRSPSPGNQEGTAPCPPRTLEGQGSTQR